MHIGAASLGILGGLVALSYGVLGYGLGSIGGSPGLQIVSIIIPLMGLAGGGIVASKAFIGAGLMAAAAIGVLLVLGFNFFTLIPVILLGIAAALGFLHGQSQTARTA